MTKRQQREPGADHRQTESLGKSPHLTRRTPARQMALATAAALGISGLAVIAANAETPADSVSMLGDLRPGARSSDPESFYDVNGRLYFSATNGTSGRELWSSDGSSRGTALVSDIIPGPEGAAPIPVGNVDSTYYFRAMGSTGAPHLWKSDGTQAGTVKVSDVRPYDRGVPDSATVGSTLFFSATGAAGGTELWRTDGTDAGTAMVKDIEPGNDNAYPQEFTVVGDTLYFTAYNLEYRRQLWKSDGTDAGTVMVKEIDNPGGNSDGPGVTGLTNVNGTLFFSAAGEGGRELWRTDGTEAGTTRVIDLLPGSAGSWPERLTAVASTLYFTAHDGDHGTELWKSNGTEAGTVLVRDIRPGSRPSQLDELTPVGDELFFLAENDDDSINIWVTDGTTAGTSPVTDTTSVSHFSQLVSHNGSLYYTAYGDEVSDVWRVTATRSTVKVSNLDAENSKAPWPLTRAGDTLFFSADDGPHGRELWRVGADPTPPTPTPTPTATVTVTAAPVTVPGPTVTLPPLPGATVTVTTSPTQAPVTPPAPAPTKTSAKASYSKKQRTAQVRVTVAPKATGRVSIRVARGKNVIRRSTLTLDSRGTALLKLSRKQVASPGTYAVTITYSGSAKHRGSSAVTKFKVPKRR